MNLPFLRKKSQFFFTNKTQLEKLLTVNDPTSESIYSILGRMEVLLDYFQSREKLHGLIPFLKTYYFVTKASAEKYIFYKHYFDNLKDYEILDVYFASLYFKPLLQFLRDEKYVSPWQHYYHYCMKADGLKLLQIVLGVNAHINTDLYKSLVDLQYHHKNDFFLVNKILQESINDTVRLMAKEQYLLGLGGLAFPHFINTEFKSTILKWRKEAWYNAHRVSNTDSRSEYLRIATNTERVAGELTEHIGNIYHFKNMASAIGHINDLSVGLEDKGGTYGKTA